MSFTGNQYVDIGNAASNLTPPYSLSLWVKPGNWSSSFNAVFVSNSLNDGNYTGFWMQMSSSTLNVAFGDGGITTGSHRRGKRASVSFTSSSEWTHVTGVVRSATDMDIFVNGVDVGGTYTGSGGSHANSAGSGSIGRLYGSQGWQSYFNGSVDELSVWSKSLTAVEIRELMCGGVDASASNLVAYYKFDDGAGTLLSNAKAAGIDGTLVNNPTWTTSGAAIGDESYYNYTSSSTRISQFATTLSNGVDIIVDNISPPVSGVQVYEVNKSPNNLNGISPTRPVANYFGRDQLNVDHTFNLRILSTNGSTEVYSREHNASSNWQIRLANVVGNDTELAQNDQNRQEYIFIPTGCTELQVNLGDDLTVCEYGDTKRLSVQNINSNYNYTWSTGQNGNTITVADTGWFYVIADSASCEGIDSIYIALSSEQSPFIFPSEMSFCEGDGVALIQINNPNYTYGWPDGTVSNSYAVYQSQVLNYMVYGSCDTLQKQIRITIESCECEVFIPNVFTPNNDGLNESWTLQSVCDPEVYNLTIYSRWGQKLYESNTINESWNGKYNGRLVSEGVYLFKLTYGRPDATKTVFGHLTVLF